MTWVVMGIYILAAAVVQTALPGTAWLGHAKPPLLLAVVLYYAMRRDGDTMLASGLAAGLFQDALGETPMGCSSLCFCAAGWILHRCRIRYLVDTLWTRMAAGALAGSGVAAGLCLLLWRAGLAGGSVWRSLWHLGGVGLLAFLCVPVVMWMLGTADGMVGNVEHEEAADVLG